MAARGIDRKKILTVILLGSLMLTPPGETKRLPFFICDFYRGLFLFYGCVDRASHICYVIYNLLTRVEFGQPACDYFACSGYGRHVGRCSSALFCLLTIERNGICNFGSVCCRNLAADGDTGFADNSTLIEQMPPDV
ncbi:hypothetical protein EGW08_014957 [Elysia chlorotica]|uniref:Uncharacterized protein n=1 Tax=Elysia chlorotica TaxID=188477 RepID=A0A433T6V8_ELYCH|nr:hypothetical protein EGW08_014957 [Elysia chlorotica]